MLNFLLKNLTAMYKWSNLITEHASGSDFMNFKP
jgi:hypothetical protein